MGSVNVIVHVVRQPLSSVTVTSYTPAARFCGSSILFVYPKPVQANVYGNVPPLTVKSIEPVDIPLIAIFIPVTAHVSKLGSVNVIVSIVLQPLSSITVTLYIPAARFCGSSKVEKKPLGPIQV